MPEMDGLETCQAIREEMLAYYQLNSCHGFTDKNNFKMAND
jgi:CheY-like chemotaxis protein